MAEKTSVRIASAFAITSHGSMLVGMQELISLLRPYLPLEIVFAVTNPSMSRFEMIPEIRLAVRNC